MGNIIKHTSKKHKDIPKYDPDPMPSLFTKDERDKFNPEICVKLNKDQQKEFIEIVNKYYYDVLGHLFDSKAIEQETLLLHRDNSKWIRISVDNVMGHLKHYYNGVTVDTGNFPLIFDMFKRYNSLNNQ